jgi:hypothetical protein
MAWQEGSATKLQSIRGLSNDFARAYKFDITFEIPTTSTALTALKTPYGDIGALMSTSCLTVVLPNSGVQAIDVEIGRHTMHLAGRNDTSGTINPEFLLGGDYKLYQFMREWKGAAGRSDSVYGEIQTSSYLFLANITIRAKDVNNATQLATKLSNVWCRNCPDINYDDGSNDIIRWAPELVYEFSEIISPTSLKS